MHFIMHLICGISNLSGVLLSSVAAVVEFLACSSLMLFERDRLTKSKQG
jgi:hypothetical protein